MRKARADQETIAQESENDIASQADLAFTIQRLALVLTTLGKSAEAEADYRTALAVMETLTERNPHDTAYRRTLAQIHANLGRLLSEQRHQSSLKQSMASRLRLKGAGSPKPGRRRSPRVSRGYPQ